MRGADKAGNKRAKAAEKEIIRRLGEVVSEVSEHPNDEWAELRMAKAELLEIRSQLTTAVYVNKELKKIIGLKSDQLRFRKKQLMELERAHVFLKHQRGQK